MVWIKASHFEPGHNGQILIKFEDLAPALGNFDTKTKIYSWKVRGVDRLWRYGESAGTLRWAEIEPPE